jgi:hypothetical protein
MVEALLQPALRAYGLEPAAWLAARADDGHINPTWFLRPAQEAESVSWHLVLQRINPAVFPRPVTVLRNQAAILDALQVADADYAPWQPASQTGPALVPLLSAPMSTDVPSGWQALAGRRGWLDTDGGVWRLQPFVAGSRTLKQFARLEQAHLAGVSFGALQRKLTKASPKLGVALPHFHELDTQLLALADWRAAVSAQAQAAVADELAAVDAHREVEAVQHAGPAGWIHGDCKLSNLLFDGTGERVLAVVDLDTTMWGRSVWDFGDLARSALSGADERGVAEDVPGGSPSALLLALAQGFLTGLEADPTDAELHSALAQAPRYMALMLAIRFLRDHLDGDRYFRVDFGGQNLERARVQLALCNRLRALEPVLLDQLARHGIRPPA